MEVEIKVPEFPESINSGTISNIYVNVGQEVQPDDLLFDIETDKVILEVVSPVQSTVSELTVAVGEVVEPNKLLCKLNSSFPVTYVSETNEEQDRSIESTPSIEGNIKGIESTSTNRSSLLGLLGLLGVVAIVLVLIIMAS